MNNAARKVYFSDPYIEQTQFHHPLRIVLTLTLHIKRTRSNRNTVLEEISNRKMKQRCLQSIHLVPVRCPSSYTMNCSSAMNRP